jgi:acyl-CoA reductase-like NAD-dependent aldehyde dehydrogenase
MSTAPSPTQPDAAVKTYQMYYGGQWRDAADGGHFDVHEPYSGKLFARVPTGGPQDAWTTRCAPRRSGRSSIRAKSA